MTLPSYAMNQLSFPEMYEKYLVGPLFRPWAEIVLSEVDLAPGNRFLDIACGTGIVARLAKERLGETGYVAGVDISPPMLAVGRSVAPDIDWREGNAGALPLGDGEQFDVVVCQQGLQFFPDPLAATQQMRRALAPKGRLAVATWCSDANMPFLRELRSVAERHLGAIDDQRYGFKDAGFLEELLRKSGFEDVRSKTMTGTTHFEDGGVFIRMNTMAFVGMSAATKGLDEEERKRVMAAIISDSDAVLKRYSDASGLAFEMSTNLVMGRG